MSARPSPSKSAAIGLSEAATVEPSTVPSQPFREAPHDQDMTSTCLPVADRAAASRILPLTEEPLTGPSVRKMSTAAAEAEAATVAAARAKSVDFVNVISVRMASPFAEIRQAERVYARAWALDRRGWIGIGSDEPPVGVLSVARRHQMRIKYCVPGISEFRCPRNFVSPEFFQHGKLRIL